MKILSTVRHICGGPKAGCAPLFPNMEALESNRKYQKYKPFMSNGELVLMVVQDDA